jgi:uncharacterized protein (TIGR03067 family)
MCRAILLVLMGGLVPTALAQTRDPVKKELRALQGTWALVVFENDRQRLDQKGIEKEFEKTAPVLLLHIEGDKLRMGKGENALSFTLRKGGKPKEGTYHVNPSVSPSRVSLSTGSEGGLAGGVITFEGIYRLRGDRLEVCVVWIDQAEFPKDFSMKAGVSWRWLLVFERITKKDRQ